MKVISREIHFQSASFDCARVYVVRMAGQDPVASSIYVRLCPQDNKLNLQLIQVCDV